MKPGKTGRTTKRRKPAGGDPRCGLCGKTARLCRTECCGNWICDDEGSYVPFSFSRSSCSRNHRRYTLCGFHSAEGHEGRWQDCERCRQEFETEMYVHYGTNEYNFDKLANPPEFEPTLCAGCGRRIDLAAGGYSSLGDAYTCMKCLVAAPSRPPSRRSPKERSG